MVGGRELPQEPVQPRDAGTAPARARRSSRSCSRRRSSSTSRRRASSCRSPSRSTPAGGSGRCGTTRATTSGRSIWRRRSPCSDNSVFSQLTALVGPPKVAAAARALGITTPLKGVLLDRPRRRVDDPARHGAGLCARSPTGASASTTRSSATSRAPSSCLEDSHGNCSATNKPVPRPALGSSGESAVRAEIMNQLLQAVVTSGTGTAAAIPGRAVAGKTGTTENYGDAWFVGYTPQLVTAVWVGYPELGAADDERVPRAARSSAAPTRR